MRREESSQFPGEVGARKEEQQQQSALSIAAAGWLESGSECRCVRLVGIEEAPDDGKEGPLALPMFRR